VEHSLHKTNLSASSPLFTQFTIMTISQCLHRLQQSIFITLYTLVSAPQFNICYIFSDTGFRNGTKWLEKPYNYTKSLTITWQNTWFLIYLNKSKVTTNDLHDIWIHKTAKSSSVEITQYNLARTVGNVSCSMLWRMAWYLQVRYNFLLTLLVTTACLSNCVHKTQSVPSWIMQIFYTREVFMNNI